MSAQGNQKRPDPFAALRRIDTFFLGGRIFEQSLLRSCSTRVRAPRIPAGSADALWDHAAGCVAEERRYAGRGEVGMSDMSEPAGILMPADGEMIPREQPQASLPFEPVEDDSHWRFWTDPDNREDIIVPHVDAVAVYLSRSGDVEIRPEACDHAHEDNIVFLTPEHARRVAAALVDLADEIERRT